MTENNAQKALDFVRGGPVADTSNGVAVMEGENADVLCAKAGAGVKGGVLGPTAYATAKVAVMNIHTEPLPGQTSLEKVNVDILGLEAGASASAAHVEAILSDLGSCTPRCG
eukprot:432577_1